MRTLYEEDVSKALACFFIASGDGPGRQPRYMHIWDGDRGPYGFRSSSAQERINDLLGGRIDLPAATRTETGFERAIGFPGQFRPDGLLIDAAGRPWVAEMKIRPVVEAGDCDALARQGLKYAECLASMPAEDSPVRSRYEFLNVLALANWTAMLYGHGSTPNSRKSYDGLAETHAWYFGMKTVLPEAQFDATPGVLLLLPQDESAGESFCEVKLLRRAVEKARAESQHDIPFRLMRIDLNAVRRTLLVDDVTDLS